MKFDSFSRLFEKKIVGPILLQIKQGVTPHRIALGISLGIALGIFPIIGATTVLCLAAGVLFKLNQPTLQLVNCLAYPLQVPLVLVFVRMGEFIFRADSIPFLPSQLKKEFLADPISFLQRFGLAGLHAIIAWTLCAPFIILVTYYAFKWSLEKMVSKKSEFFKI